MKSRFHIAMVVSALSFLTPPTFAQKATVAIPADVPIISTFSYFDPIEAIFRSKQG